MCGIMGYVGKREAVPMLVDGLRRLEYRGYDSAGLATVARNSLHLAKCAGRIADLDRYLNDHPPPGPTGIGPPGWAPHGPATAVNAHPHTDARRLAVVHNGVIENYLEIRKKLQAEGVVFQSETDTEVIAQ